MAIINSCCFWKSLRKGCLASALYTLVSYAFAFACEMRMFSLMHIAEMRKRILKLKYSEIRICVCYLTQHGVFIIVVQT